MLNRFLPTLALTLLALPATAAPVTYPGPQATDTSGAVVSSGVTASVASVTDLDGTAIASPGAVAHVAGPNVSVVYDAAAKGEAWITLSLTATGHTFANVALYCSADPQTLASTNAKATQLTFTGGNVNAATQNFPATVTVGTNNDKTGYSGTATNFVASPTVPQIAAGILLTPSNLLATDGSNRVTTSNPATGGSGVTEASIWSYATRTLTAQSDSPGVTTLLGRPAQTGDAYGLLSPLVSAGKFTAPALSNAPASTFPGDYQQRGVAVTLPTTAPSGYGGSGAAPTVGQIAAAILATPSNLLATDSSGRVTTSNPASSSSGPTAADFWAYSARSLTDKAGFALASGEYASIAAATAAYAVDRPAGTILAVTVTRNGSNQPVVTWTADPLAVSYKVMRSVDGTNYTQIAAPAAGTLTYTDTARPNVTTVYYHVSGTH